MDRELVEKIEKEVKSQGMNPTSVKKLRRSLLYRISVPLTQSSLTPAFLIEAEKGGSEEKLIAVQKSGAEKEFKKLKEIHEDSNLNHSVKVPEPYSLLKDEEIIIMEYLEGKPLSELIVLHHFLMGPRKKEVRNIFRKTGKMLGKLHGSTSTGEKIQINTDFQKRINSIEKELPYPITEKLESIPKESIELPECHIHGDVGLGNLKYDGENVKLVDWITSELNYAFKDLHRSRYLLRRKNKYCFFIDLEEMWEELLSEYENTIDFEFGKEELNISGIDFLLNRIERRPERANKKLYINLLMDYTEGLQN